MHISVVSPVYRAPTILPELVERLNIEISKITDSFEIILVDDGCPLQSWNIIEDLSNKYSFVKGIQLSRNFGQHYAITAGLNFVKGEWIIVMDCDLQDRPEEICNLYKTAQNNWDIVLASRQVRNDTLFKKWSSRVFSIVYSYLGDLESDHKIANFGIYNKQVIRQYCNMKDYSRSFPSLVNYLGYKKTTIPVVHSYRAQGTSSYTLMKLINLSLDIILSNSNKPLKITTNFGLFISIISFCIAGYNVVANLLGLITVKGFTATIFSIWFVGGLITFSLGILGLYTGLIFNQVKERPLYVIRKITSEKIA